MIIFATLFKIILNRELMSEDKNNNILEKVTTEDYKYGFYSDIEMDMAPKGLNEDTVRFISAKKNEPEWLLEFRLKAFRYWQKMEEPEWALIHHPPIKYQDIIYYAAPKKKKELESLNEVDPELLETFNNWESPSTNRKCWLV